MTPRTTLRATLWLFDIDGTLIGADGAGRRALDRALEETLGVARPLADIRLDGMTDPGILHQVFMRHHNRPPEAGESETIFASYERHLGPEVARSAYHVKPGVTEALDRLEAHGAQIGLATGNLAATARIKLERGDLWRRFPFGGFGSDALERAELVRVAIERARRREGRRAEQHGGSAPAQTVVIGDTPNDITAAHDAGARAIGVATGSFSVDDLKAAGADEVYPTLSEWVPALK